MRASTGKGFQFNRDYIVIDGIFLTGHHTLIEGNDISLTGHNPINTRGFSTGTAAHHIIDPLFIDPNNEDFNLESNSQLINAGTFLTNTISSGSGSIITVEDAGYFCDGYGITEGDLIQLEGEVETVRIIEVDYDNNIIIIDSSLVWVAGQGIGLPYNGSAPDMGAFEYDGTTSI